ncbi:sn-glycerol-3-phosphate ABC transporter ATP-binding protein UgpC, partial [Paraburkholderia sp. SIMBA_030]
DVVVRLPHADRPARGTALGAALPSHRLHFFDPETGKRAG